MLSRRSFVLRLTQLGGLVVAPSLLAACAPAPAPAPAAPAAPAPAPAAPAAPAAAPAPKAAPAAPASKFNLVWGSSEFPVRVNPQYTTNVPTTMFYDIFYDTLTRRDPDMKLLPGLATEWKLLNDTTWQVKLRPNVKWHNGDPFTAADVKFTIDRTSDPEAKTIHGTVFNTVKQIDIVDDLTLNFQMKAPDSLLPGRFAHYGGYLLPSRYFKAVGADEFEKKPIGTGPFKLIEFVKDDHVTLEANKEYWGGAPNVDGVLIRPLPEAAARIAALQKGDVHFIDRVPNDQMDAIGKTANLQTFSVPFAGVQYLVLNCNVAPLDKKPLRQAMNLAIDRPSLAKDLFLDRSALATGPIPNGEFGSKAGLKPPDFDVKKARELIAQSGYNGEEFPLEVLLTDKTLAEAITAMWKEVGINARLQVIEGSVRSQKIANKAFTGVFSAAFVSILADPAGLMWRSLGPGGILSPFWTNAEWERLGIEAVTLLDQAKRRANYERMAEIMMDELPWIVLFQPAQNFAAQKNIQWRPHPNFMLDFRKENLAIKQ